MRRFAVILALLWSVGTATARPGDAVEALAARLRQSPSDPGLLRSLGWALMEYRHDPSAAYPLLARAVATDAGDLNGHKLLALAAAGSGRISRAIAEFDLVLARDPADVWMWVNFGRALMAVKEFARARRAFLQALQLQPGYRPAVQSLHDWSFAREPRGSFALQTFNASGGFSVTAASASAHCGVGDIGQLAIAADHLVLAQGNAQVRRDDLAAAVDLAFSRSLDLRLGALATSRHGADRRVSGDIAAAWSLPGTTLRWSAQVRTPVFPDNLRAALLDITANQAAFALDRSLRRDLTFQGVAEYGQYNDGNRRRYARVQLSLRLPVRGQFFARLAYQRLAFSAASPDYFSPAHFEIIRPQVDYTAPITRWLDFNAQAAVPFLPRESRLGRSFAWGVRAHAAGFTVHVSGTDDLIPTARAWSGRGVRIEGTWTF